MIKIDTQKWKEFAVGELFDIRKPDARSRVSYSEGNVPFIASGGYNNGVLAYLTPKDNEKIDKGNCITVSPIDGSCFYQPQDFLGRGGAGSSILLLYNKNLNKCNGRFISTVLQKICKKYLFADMGTAGNIVNEHIKLPVTASGEPDWEYMERYIVKIENAAIKLLDSLSAINETKRHKIDTQKWKEFCVGDLFEKLDLKILNKKFNKKVDVAEQQTEEFSLPLVNAKHFNNGIQFYGREKDFEFAEMTLDVIKNGAIATGDVFPQPQKTGVLWDAYLLKLKGTIKSVSVLKFLSTVLQKSIKEKFAWNDKCIWNKVKILKIKLPVTASNEPDWEYMEQYISGIENNSAEKLTRLQKLIAQ